MKQKWIDFYFSVAQSAAQLSTAVRLQVGCVIVRDHKILATGYNGTPQGWDNVCEDSIWNPHLGSYTLKTRAEVLHAESNAIAKIARSTESSVDSELFCTHAPCLECAKLIYQSGVHCVRYRSHYRSSEGLEFLAQGGVRVEHCPQNTGH